MKRLLICTALINLLINVQAKAEIKPYGCDGKDILLEQKDFYTVVCANYYDTSQYHLIKWHKKLGKDDKQIIDCTIYAEKTKTNRIKVDIIEIGAKKAATFYIKNRKFDGWVLDFVDVSMVDKYKNEITTILNTIEKIENQSF